MQTASRLCSYKYIIIIIIIYSYTPYVHNLKILNVTLLQSYNVTFEKKLAKMVHNSKIICIFAPKKSKI